MQLRNSYKINCDKEHANILFTDDSIILKTDDHPYSNGISYENVLAVNACNCSTACRSKDSKDVLSFIRQDSSRKCVHCIAAHGFIPGREISFGKIQLDERSTSIRIYYVEFLNTSSALHLKTICIELGSRETRNECFHFLSSKLQRLRKRPRRLLVFINPYGGKKKALQIYERKVEPIFRICRIHCEVVKTTHSGHCKEVLFTKDLSVYDGVICVGGDGMANELINALVQKSFPKIASEGRNISPLTIPIGVIPAGSTDSLVCTTTGTHCAMTSALLIATGARLQTDLGSIHSENRCVKFFAGFLSHGFFGDNVEVAEKYRWLGPFRYTWTGWQTFLKNKTFSGTVTIEKVVDEDSPNGRRCFQGCEKCASESRHQSKQTRFCSFDAEMLSLSVALIANRCAKSKAGIAPNAHVGDGLMDTLVVKQCSRLEFLRFLMAVSHSDHHDPFAFNFTNSYKVASFKFTPNPYQRQTSVWNCDGEILHVGKEVTVRTHRKCLTLFANGGRSALMEFCESLSQSSDSNSVYE